MATIEPTTVRRIWKLYREGLEDLPLSPREKRPYAHAFYIGAIAMCRMLKHLARRGETERTKKIINRTAVYMETAERARRRFRN